MINITIDKDDLLEYLQHIKEDEDAYKTFMRLSEREQNDLIDNLLYLCYKQVDEDYISYELLERLTK
jgi:hypothetical protein